MGETPYINIPSVAHRGAVLTSHTISFLTQVDCFCLIDHFDRSSPQSQHSNGQHDCTLVHAVHQWHGEAAHTAAGAEAHLPPLCPAAAKYSA